MKISISLLLILICLAGCQKDAQVLPEIATTKTVAVVTASQPTMPDGAAFNVQLAKDEINTDDCAIVFNKNASANYDLNEDAPYFWGNGQVNLASISNDGRDLAINTLPYTSKMLIGLDMKTKTDGAYSFKLDYQKNLPTNLQIWLKDTYLKDSVDVRVKTYKFNVIKADANTYGNKRFVLIIKTK